MSAVSKKSKKPSPSAETVAPKPALDHAVAEARQAFEADQPARDALPATALRGRPRPDRVPAIASTCWQILSHASRPNLAPRLGILEQAGELPPGLIGGLRTAILAFEHAAARVARVESARAAPASAAAALPIARAVFERLYAGADFYWGEDEPEVRAALDAMKPRASAAQIARHLGSLERLIRARIAELGPKTGRLKLEDLDAARDLRNQLRPSVDPSLDLDQIDQDLERAYARLDRLYGELAAALNYLERNNRGVVGWPGLNSAGSKPRQRKAKAKAGTPPEAKAKAARPGVAPPATEAKWAPPTETEPPAEAAHAGTAAADA
jgi:hypothetical protein